MQNISKAQKYFIHIYIYFLKSAGCRLDKQNIIEVKLPRKIYFGKSATSWGEILIERHADTRRHAVCRHVFTPERLIRRDIDSTHVTAKPPPKSLLETKPLHHHNATASDPAGLCLSKTFMSSFTGPPSQSFTFEKYCLAIFFGQKSTCTNLDRLCHLCHFFFSFRLFTG